MEPRISVASSSWVVWSVFLRNYFWLEAVKRGKGLVKCRIEHHAEKSTTYKLWLITQLKPLVTWYLSRRIRLHRIALAVDAVLSMTYRVLCLALDSCLIFKLTLVWNTFAYVFQVSYNPFFRVLVCPTSGLIRVAVPRVGFGVGRETRFTLSSH